MPASRKVLLLAAVACALGLGAWAWSARHTPTEGRLRLSGNIEVTSVELSFRVPGQLRERLLGEGETVRAGQVVARLDPAPLERELDARKADVALAQAALAELLAGSRPEEIAQAEAAVRRAEAALNELKAGSRPQEIAASSASAEAFLAVTQYLRLERDRQKYLADNGAVPKRDFDLLDAARNAAEGLLREAGERLKLVREGPRSEQIAQALAALQQMQAALDLVRKGSRAETIDQARARLDQARAAQALAQLRLDYAALPSPVEGWVLAEHAEAGEYVAQGMPVLTVADLRRVWMRAYVDAPDLERLRLGARVRVLTDSPARRVHEGTLSFISPVAEFTPKTVQTQKERVKLVHRIKIDIPNPDLALKPGMAADAELGAPASPSDPAR